MVTKNLAQERISVFADGETSDEQLDIALADLRNEDGRASWELYHQIGDLLRSDEMAIPLSAAFSPSMAARLAAEPVLIAPLHARGKKTGVRRLALPGVLAAAAAAVAFVATPQLMVAMQGAPASSAAIAVVATDAARARLVMRDQGLDEYLMAHQRFSPSVYSSAQYARSATFANESGK